MIDATRGMPLMTFSLLPCDATGMPVSPLAHMPDALATNYQGTAALYQRVGFAPPWIGHVAVVAGRGMGRRCVRGAAAGRRGGDRLLHAR